MEFSWIRKPDFFPPKPRDPDGLKSICIGTKSRTLGDCLILSTLPRKLKERYPGIRVHVFPRAFNPIVFRNNPEVDGISYFPKTLYGDDANWGSGHLIQVKENFFDLPMSAEPKPEIYLSDRERAWAKEWIRNNSDQTRHGLPLCLLHPWGHTHQNVAPLELWAGLVSRWKDRFRFGQVGVEGHVRIPGCDFWFFSKKSFASARELFSLTGEARAFIGVNSGPMHVARAFEINSLIFVETADLKEIFERRSRLPYFLLRKHEEQAFLYTANEHWNCTGLNPEVGDQKIDSFLSKVNC